MNKPRKALSEYERKYNRSRLTQWLKLPTWTAHEGVCLVCGIDPTGAEIQWDGFENAHGVHVDEPKIERGQLLTEAPDGAFGLTREEYIELASQEPPYEVWLSAEFFSVPPGIFAVEEERWATEKIFKPAWMRYVRNPEHTELNNRRPHEFIDWAVANDIEVPWLAWAQDHGFFDGTSKAPEKQEPDLTTKKRRNYLTVIAALLKYHGYDLDKAPAESISMITAEYGRPIGTKTIRGYIKEIREEIEPDIDPR